MSAVAVDNFSTANLPHSLSNAKGYVAVGELGSRKSLSRKLVSRKLVSCTPRSCKSYVGKMLNRIELV